jgi:hypothetical protein
MSNFAYNRADDFPAGGGDTDQLFRDIRGLTQAYGEYRRFKSEEQGDYFTGVGLVDGPAGQQMLLGAAIQPDYILRVSGLAEVHRAVPGAVAVLALRDETTLLYEEAYLRTAGQRRPPAHVFEKCTVYVGRKVAPDVWSRGYTLSLDEEGIATGYRYEWRADGSAATDEEGNIPRMLSQECAVLSDVVRVLGTLVPKLGMRSRPAP